MQQWTRQLCFASIVCCVVAGAHEGRADAAPPATAAGFDAAGFLAGLEGKDAAPAKDLVGGLSDDQIRAVVGAYDPEYLSDELRPDVFTQVQETARRPHTAWQARRKAIEDEWDKRTGLDAYPVVGQHSPAWDNLALDALRSDSSVSIAEGAKKYRAAVDAGCTDPLIRYYRIRRSVMTAAIKPAVALPQYLAVLPAMDASGYSPIRKFQIRMQIINACLTDMHDPANRATAEAMFKAAVQALPTLAAERGSPALFEDAGDTFRRAGKLLEHNIKEDHDAIAPGLRHLLPDSAYPDYFDATFYIDWAWKARGNGMGDTVTDEGWKLFRERLIDAEDFATRGAAAEPLDGRCAASMITICMGLGFDRTVMERWFARAMLANPDNYSACIAKYTYLAPKWHGSAQEELDFGRQCAEFGSVRSRIPTILVDIHVDLSANSDEPDDYFAQPEVWADIEGVYKKLLADSKTERELNRLRFDRAKYIQYAYRCRQWQTLLDLEKEFGDDVDVDVLGGKETLALYARNAKLALERMSLR
jgi:hypothetical protein